MGMGYAYGESKEKFMERREVTLAKRLSKNGERMWCIVSESEVTDADAAELAKIIQPKKKGRPKGSKNKAK